MEDIITVTIKKENNEILVSIPMRRFSRIRDVYNVMANSAVFFEDPHLYFKVQGTLVTDYDAVLTNDIEIYVKEREKLKACSVDHIFDVISDIDQFVPLNVVDGKLEKTIMIDASKRKLLLINWEKDSLIKLDKKIVAKKKSLKKSVSFDTVELRDVLNAKFSSYEIVFTYDTDTCKYVLKVTLKDYVKFKNPKKKYEYHSKLQVGNCK